MLRLPTLPSDYRLISDPDSDLLDEVYRLRVVAWESQARIRNGVVRWGDEYDRFAKHWVIATRKSAVAAIRLTLHNSVCDLPAAAAFTGVLPEDLPFPIASYNRLVVHPDHRGKGLARFLDIACINAAEAANASVLLGVTGNVEGNKSRIPAMKALGFVVMGTAAAFDVDIIEDEGLSTVLAYFYDKQKAIRSTPRLHSTLSS